MFLVNYFQLGKSVIVLENTPIFSRFQSSFIGYLIITAYIVVVQISLS